jgi:hypothetical protein
MEMFCGKGMGIAVLGINMLKIKTNTTPKA